MGVRQYLSMACSTGCVGRSDVLVKGMLRGLFHCGSRSDVLDRGMLHGLFHCGRSDVLDKGMACFTVEVDLMYLIRAWSVSLWKILCT